MPCADRCGIGASDGAAVPISMLIRYETDVWSSINSWRLHTPHYNACHRRECMNQQGRGARSRFTVEFSSSACWADAWLSTPTAPTPTCSPGIRFPAECSSCWLHTVLGAHGTSQYCVMTDFGRMVILCWRAILMIFSARSGCIGIAGSGKE